MKNRTPNGAGLFIAPAANKLKLTITLHGVFAEQLEQWALAEAEKFREWPDYQRELRGERRRLAFMLLCEAIGAVAAQRAPWIKDAAVDAVIAPRLEAVAGEPRRVEQLDLVFCARGLGLDFQMRRRN